MEKFYYLSWKEGKEPIASAFAPKGSKSDYELIKELNGVNIVPFELNLVRLDISKNGLVQSDDLHGLKEIWRDLQPNNLAWPLMSERLKSLIEANLTGNEQIDWISCTIKSANEARTYYILRFNKMLDVLDMQRTIFVPGTDFIYKPVFAISKVSTYNVFPVPSSNDSWKITNRFYISDTLKKALQKAKLPGLTFEKTIAI